MGGSAGLVYSVQYMHADFVAGDWVWVGGGRLDDWVGGSPGWWIRRLF